MTVPIGDKKVSLSVKEVVAKSTNYDAIDYKVTKYIFEPGIKKVEIDGYHNSSVKSVIFEGDNTQVDIYFNGNYPLDSCQFVRRVLCPYYPRHSQHRHQDRQKCIQGEWTHSNNTSREPYHHRGFGIL